MMSERLPRLADDLIAEALACDCDKTDGPLCARCECLVELARAIDIYAFEQMAGAPWHAVVQDVQNADQLRRIGGLRGLGYACLGYALEGATVAYYLCWVLPVTTWRRWRTP